MRRPAARTHTRLGEPGRASEHSVFYDVFFFSSRRRHTRFDCDWSSDVCSSDCVAGVCRVHNMIHPFGFRSAPKLHQTSCGASCCHFGLLLMRPGREECARSGGDLTHWTVTGCPPESVADVLAPMSTKIGRAHV